MGSLWNCARRPYSYTPFTKAQPKFLEMVNRLAESVRDEKSFKQFLYTKELPKRTLSFTHKKNTIKQINRTALSVIFNETCISFEFRVVALRDRNQKSLVCPTIYPELASGRDKRWIFASNEYNELELNSTCRFLVSSHQSFIPSLYPNVVKKSGVTSSLVFKV